MDLIVGANGFLGKNINQKFNNCLNLKRDGVYKKNKKTYSDLLDCINNEEIDTIFNCAVSYNENNLEELEEINFQLPKQIIEKTKNNNIKVILFGSFFEKEKKSYMFNYVSSKNRLSNYLKNLDNKNVYHLTLEHIYGKYDRLNKFIPSVVRNIKERNKILLNSPNNVRDFTPVDHVVNFCKTIKDSGYKKNFINVGCGMPQTSLKFINKLIDYFATKNGYSVNEIQSLIEIKKSNINSIKKSFCSYPNLIDSFTIDYFKKLEDKAIKDIFDD